MAGMQAVVSGELRSVQKLDKFAALSPDLIFDIFKLSSRQCITTSSLCEALAQFDLILIQLMWLDREP